MRIDEIEKAVATLPPDELDAFSQWFADFRARLRPAHSPSVPSDDAAFEADMAALADSTEAVSPYGGTYGREDIYLDHD